MSLKHKFYNVDGAYFVTFAVKDWADVFIRSAYKNILVGGKFGILPKEQGYGIICVVYYE